MAKSKGNFYTFRDLVEQGHDPRAIRYLLLSVPHARQLNFTKDGLKGAETVVTRLEDFRLRLNEAHVDEGSTQAAQEMVSKQRQLFEEAMDDDLNTAEALAAIHDLVRETNTALAGGTLKRDDVTAVSAFIDGFDSVFNVIGRKRQEMLDSEIQALIDERQAARGIRNFKRADEIREELAARQIILEDTKDGVRWRRSK
jgi:cysteinyl-tRNA synthetase